LRPARRLLALLIPGVVALSGGQPAVAQSGSSWAQYQQGPGRSGSLASAPAAAYRVAWHTATGIGDSAHVAGLPAPAIDGDDAIVVGRQDVTAVAVGTGAVDWTVPRELGPSAPAAVAAGSILFPEGGGDESSSAATASPSATTSFTPSSPSGASAIPSVAGSSAACRTPAPTSPGTPRLVALDAATHSVRWRLDLPGVSRTGAVVDGGFVAIGTDGGTVVAVDPSTGKVRWTKDVGDCIDVPLAAADGIVYVAARSVERAAPQIVALRESDGTNAWAQPYVPRTSSTAIGAPSVVGGTLYVALADATVRAVDAATGSERWATRLNAFVGGAPPVVVGDAVVVADTRGQVYRLDASSGSRIWDFAMNTSVIGAPAVAGSTILVPTADGDLAAFDLDSGHQIWRASLGDGDAGLALALTADTIVLARTGSSPGLVGLVNDPNGSLTDIESPTVLKPALLLGGWALAAIPLVLLLLLAGRALSARLGPVGPIGVTEDWDPDDPALRGGANGEDEEEDEDRDR